MREKSPRENKVPAARVDFTLACVLVLLMIFAAATVSRAEGPSANGPLYIEVILADLEQAWKNLEGSERKIDRINAFRAGLSLPKDAAADAKAAEALKVAEEALRKTEENIDRLEKALPDAEKALLRSVGALAHRLKWSGEELKRLGEAFSALPFDKEPTTTSAQKRKVWKEMLSRRGKDFADDASKGAGPTMQSAGAGEQIDENSDCTVFALANAAGVPYGVAASRAAELLREAQWRPPASRENPGVTIEEKGLYGAEVIFMAESLGQAEVIKSTDFMRALKEGRPVLANVAPQHGGSGGHQVVITKTFQRGGETWYEMMDSAQGPRDRLYLSAGELDTILLENGIAFSPEREQKPRMLR